MLEVDIQSVEFLSGEGVSIKVLRDIKFSCLSDSFTCIVGPSGCGKTTTLRCILGLEKNYLGTISTGANTGAEDKISAVFQEPRLLPWRTVEQNITLPLNGYNPQELDTLFEVTGLTQHRQFYPTELSLGLARRVAIARAFALEPELLILDEPFVSLDEQTAGKLRRLLLTVWAERSCTALMVTHNLTEAIELADRILFFDGAPSRVVADYEITLERNQRDRGKIEEIRQDIFSLGLLAAESDAEHRESRQ